MAPSPSSFVLSATTGGRATAGDGGPASMSVALLSFRMSYLRLPLYPSEASPVTDDLPEQANTHATTLLAIYKGLQG